MKSAFLLMLLLSCALLAGCISQVSLLAQDGVRYEMHVDQLTKGLSTTIDGIVYTGTTVSDETIGSSFSTLQPVGSSSIIATGFSLSGGNNGRALLTSAAGDYIECTYTVQGTRAIGKCQSNKGRQFVLTTQ